MKHFCTKKSLTCFADMPDGKGIRGKNPHNNVLTKECFEASEAQSKRDLLCLNVDRKLYRLAYFLSMSAIRIVFN